MMRNLLLLDYKYFVIARSGQRPRRSNLFSRLLRGLRPLAMTVGALLIIAIHSMAESAVSVEELFKQANKAYEEGNFDKAIERYENIVSSDKVSSVIYFNLGNAYYKKGSIGKSILNYERAMRLSPNDTDIKTNFEYVNASVRTVPGDFKSIWNTKLIKSYVDRFTNNGLLLISSAIYLVGVLLLIIWAVRRFYPRKLLISAIFLFAVMFLNLFIAWHKIEETRSEAIIITEQAEAHYGPFESATVFFKASEGSKVNVLKKKDKWYKIRRQDGKAGWVEENSLEII